MIEKIEIHVVVVRLGIVLCDWEVFVQVKGYDVFETQPLFLVHSYQLFVHTKRSTSGS